MVEQKEDSTDYVAHPRAYVALQQNGMTERKNRLDEESNGATESEAGFDLPTTFASSSCSSSSMSSSIAPPSSNSSKQFVTKATVAISEGKLEVVDEILALVVKISICAEIGRVNGYGFRFEIVVNPAKFPPPVAEIFGDEHSAATQSLYRREVSI
ncbi:hypothetical protein SDJN03_17130, partial [Cucurbita argyrosperma subsp. sororia]